ncbi:MAG: histidine phosphatase family protein [Candidatus Absconditicoccaceae bacterium]
MAIRITYFVHGSTTDNEEGLSSGRYDVELSEVGIGQSLELRNQIDTSAFDIVFCSDFKRAVDSAKLAFEDKVEIIQDTRLRECNYGEYNQKASALVEPIQEKSIHKKFPGGESYEDVKKRIEDFLNFLKINYDDKHVAIVAHKAPQLALDVIIKGKTRKEAFADDRRKTKEWQPGWEYVLE